MAGMMADRHGALNGAVAEENRVPGAAASLSDPSEFEARLAELAARIDRLEKGVAGRLDEIEFRLGEVESGLVVLSRPGWPF